LKGNVIEPHELNDAGFTEGYRHAIDAKPRRLGAPMEMILLVPDRIVFWRNGYEEGFAKGKVDRRALKAWREKVEAAKRADAEQEQSHER
jgi:hypothetical protein